jgi:hypothetical protein
MPISTSSSENALSSLIAVATEDSRSRLARADEPRLGRVSSERLRASSDALCARTIELPRWPLASLASLARASLLPAAFGRAMGSHAFGVVPPGGPLFQSI